MPATLSNVKIDYEFGSIKNNHISNVAADIISVDKVAPLFTPSTNLGFAIGATPTTREEILYVAKGAGTIRGFHALLNVDGSSTGITVDLKKNGTTVISAPVALTDSTGDRVSVAGTITVPAFVAGDVLSVAMIVTTSTGAQGPHAWAVLTETAVPTS